MSCILDDPTRALMEELVRGDYLDRVHIGLDYFDASINRVAAWVIGARATHKALLLALLEPLDRLRHSKPKAITPPPRPARGSQEPALRRGLGRILPPPGCAPPASTGWTR